MRDSSSVSIAFHTRVHNDIIQNDIIMHSKTTDAAGNWSIIAKVMLGTKFNSMLNFCLTRCLICDGHLQKYDTVGPVLINSDGNIREL